MPKLKTKLRKNYKYEEIKKKKRYICRNLIKVKKQKQIRDEIKLTILK